MSRTQSSLLPTCFPAYSATKNTARSLLKSPIAAPTAIWPPSSTANVQCLIEVKAAGTELKDSHTKQAVDYAANQGVDWVVLTNASQWKVYNVLFSKPVGQDMVLDLDILALNAKHADDIESLFLLTKEGFIKSALGDFSAQRQALNRFYIAATLLTDHVLDVIRRELRHVSPDVKIDTEEIKSVLTQEVLKRDVIEGEKADEARKKINRAMNRYLKAKAVGANGGASHVEVAGNQQPSENGPVAGTAKPAR